MELSTDFKAYQEQITSSLIEVTRSAAHISQQDLSFHRSANEKFSKSLDEQNDHLLRLTSKLIKAATRDSAIKVPSIQNGEDIEDNWRRIVDVVDDVLEKADACLDEFTGALKRLSPATSDAEPSPKRVKYTSGLEQWSRPQIQRPQQFFERKVNNYETEPWKPLLRSKPHAIKPLAESLILDGISYKHPYAHEIEMQQFPSSVYQFSEPIPYTPPEASSAIFVDTEEGVQEMLKELQQASEIAVDLEHNDRNSYVGMVCLMQISTREKDWIVDTLKPWRENLQILNEVFADPKIMKVFHGSTSDIIWLQRDLGLYVVGLFDTFHACNALAFPGRGLKYLLQRFANFEAQKQYQLADWRIRPLPQELLDYARSDTHYLLYIYDNLKNMLLEASTPDWNYMTQVLDASKQECLQTYQRHPYDAENGLGPAGWLKLLMTRSTGYTNEQFGVFRALHEWRDQKARELDEGEQAVLPNSFVFAWAEDMPARKTQFFGRGLGRLPPHINSMIPELVQAIWKGREAGKKGPSIFEAIEKNGDKVGNMFGRNKYIRRKVEEPNQGVAATLQLLNQNKSGESTTPVQAPDTSSDALSVSRAQSSRLFGEIDPITLVNSANRLAIEQALQQVLLLDLVQGEVLSTELNITTDLDQSISPNPITNGTSQVHADDLDTITLRGRSRKRKADDATLAPDNVISSAPTDHSTPIMQSQLVSSEPVKDTEEDKHESKRRRKAEKKAKKAQQAAERRAAEQQVAPFDYANAESILHAKSQPTTDGQTTAVKPLNPFARAMDTSTGARRGRAGKELPGRSHTFQS